MCPRFPVGQGTAGSTLRPPALEWLHWRLSLFSVVHEACAPEVYRRLLMVGGGEGYWSDSEAHRSFGEVVLGGDNSAVGLNKDHVENERGSILVKAFPSVLCAP